MSDLSGNSLSVSKRRAKSIQLAPWTSAITGSVDWTSLGDDPMGDMQIFAGATNQGKHSPPDTGSWLRVPPVTSGRDACLRRAGSQL